MKLVLVSDSYREMGKTLLNIGQSIIIAMFLALLLKERVSPWLGVIGIASGIISIILGIYYVQKAYHKRKLEEKQT
ncbi:MAG: hypothetical protein ONB44_12395 [candidate division KSB1 bacterium]|nr:hypothetical protein [candidate division KSB1 bacterium]MDZ7302921.1 hypothetical protein [candidate division KSB1 bacterium]MDZ7310496.1 hypothetical protein [candidate division KSB1 bacterium]